MTDNTIPTTLLLIMFILVVWASLNYLEEGAAFQSFIVMLGAIFVLFGAYVYLSDSLEEKLKAVK
jgi:hypothetical protein